MKPCHSGFNKKIKKHTKSFGINVSLLQLEKAIKLYRKKEFTQIRAFLLLILFASALLIQALHHHEPDAANYRHSAYEQTQSSTQFKAYKINCKLCEVLKQQGHDCTLTQPDVTVVKQEMASDFHFRYSRRHPVTYILSAANKGPPSFIA
ncbi:hypothetical protein CBW18_11600 [Pedobacter sp. AJM]|nr:hypothetical protein CBW18_11600 [Pedobacter sp. AJM]